MVFGVTTVSLVISGGKAYTAIVRSKDANSELRIASSYINMKIRQNDRSGDIRVVKSQVGTGNAIVIEEHAGTDVYETWIYQDSGKLREGYVRQGAAVTNEISFDIASVEGFGVTMDTAARSINVDVWLMNGEEKMERTNVIHLRTE
jgi:hypothetical protein